MKAGVWILVALTSPPARWHKHHRARTGNRFSDQAVDERLSLVTSERSGEMLAYDVERAQKRFMLASTSKCSLPRLRSMPERP